MLSFDILGACEGLANKLAGMDWPTNQSFYGKPILDFVRAPVCSLVYRFRANKNDPDALKATTCVRVILKFRQVHVDRSHRIDAVFPNLIDELRPFAPVQFADEL
jgi:hypothetical protein